MIAMSCRCAPAGGDSGLCRRSFASTRWCKLDRFQLPPLLTLNSTRRVWADASSGCLLSVLKKKKKQTGAIFGYFV